MYIRSSNRITRLFLVSVTSQFIVIAAWGQPRPSKPVIREIVPAVSFPERATNGLIDLKIFGDNFPTDPGELVVRFSKHGKLDLVTDSQNNDTNLVLVHIVDDSQINLGRVRRDDTFPRLTVQVGRKYPEKETVYSDPYPLLISNVERTTPRVAAAAVTLAVLTLPICLLVWRRKNGEATTDYRVGDRSYNVLLALFLDPETDTFSLSKFQFYLWTAAAVFGYVYLTVARSLVQGLFELADIPEHLPGIILISATTAAAAQGVTSAKGPKGAGAMQPSFSDFITTGGVVAPERFQFFVWTCMGVGAFVFMILQHDPGFITDLPRIPERFLYLMGLSSLGYLGGKAVREPGPIIDQIRATLSSLLLEVHGRNLSKDASFEINGQPVTLDMLMPADDQPTKVPQSEEVGAGGAVAVIEKDPQSRNRELAKVLALTIARPKPDWFLKECQLTIINRDGQRATWSFEYRGDFSMIVTPTERSGPLLHSEQFAELHTLGKPAMIGKLQTVEFDYSKKAAALKIQTKLLNSNFAVEITPKR